MTQRYALFISACALTLAMFLPSTSDARAGIIVTVGCLNGERPATELDAARHQRPDEGEQDRTPTCRRSDTHEIVACPISKSSERDPKTGLPTEWDCRRIGYRRYLCDTAEPHNLHLTPHSAHWAGDGDEIEVLGCAGGSGFPLHAVPLALGIGGLLLRRRRATSQG